jgi:flagellar basal body-associated protein FliL
MPQKNAHTLTELKKYLHKISDYQWNIFSQHEDENAVY